MNLVKPVDVVPADRLGRVHFIGIGGAGMSGIARVLACRGVDVSGSDAKDSPILSQLGALGARVHVGHDARFLGDADTVVVSTAIRDNNPELVEARGRGLRVLPRAAALAALMADRRALAVAGTHGKTTTSAMLTVVLQHCGAEPSYVIGGTLSQTGLGADEGSGDLFVAEADESDGSFLMLSPHAAIITNVEADHLDNYGDEAAVRATFLQFTERVGELLVVCADDPGARALTAPARARGLTVRTYGTAADADYRLHTISPRGHGSTCEIAGCGTLELAVPGRHNAVNATGVVALAAELGLAFAGVRAGLAAFAGTDRRFERKGEVGAVRVYDSYAHHPTELVADLRTARELAENHFGGAGRVIAVFQPHLYSRTRIFAAEFGQALSLADEVVVLDVYAAREDPEPGVTGALIADTVPLPTDRVRFLPDPAEVPGLVADIAKPGDVVITMGAGDVTELGPRILGSLAARSGTTDA